MKIIIAFSFIFLFSCSQREELSTVIPKNLKNLDKPSFKKVNHPETKIDSQHLSPLQEPKTKISKKDTSLALPPVPLDNNTSLSKNEVSKNNIKIKMETKVETKVSPDSANPKSYSTDFRFIMTQRPKTKEALKIYENKAFDLLKDRFNSLNMDSLYILNEKVLLNSDDGIFHVFGSMLDFRKKNYSKVLVRANAALQKPSRFSNTIHKTLYLYKISALKEINKKYPNEEAAFKFNNERTKFLLTYSYPLLQLPSSENNFNHLTYIN